MSPYEYLLILGVALIMLIFFMYMFWRETTARSKEKPAEIYTVVRCDGGVEKRRKYQEGDYVGRAVPDCAGGVVVGIYKEVPQTR
ncbi:MAG: hypothetical protein ABWK05_09345 [Pyrobaculum sp.]